MMPPLLPPTGSATRAAAAPATTAPAPAPAIAVPAVPQVPAAYDPASETVEMPLPTTPAEQPAERLLVIPASRETAPSLRSRLTTTRMRRGTTPAKVDLLPPGAELTRVEDMRRPFRRPMTVLVANPKGGSGKTPLTLLMAGTLSLMRGGHVLAWDNNESRGGLAFRANPRGVARPGEDGNLTVRDLLADLAMFETHQAGMGELAAYLRPQDELFDVLASDEDPGSLAQIRSADFARLHAVLRRYYRILILDSGNNVRSEAWQAAALAADCLVLASSYDADSVAAADWTLEHLVSIGRADLVDRAVTVLTAAGGRPDPAQQADAHQRFVARTAAVVDIAHDPKLRSGERVGRATVAEATTAAVIQAAQAVVAQLCLVDAPTGTSTTAEDTAADHGLALEFEEAAAEALALVEHSGRRLTAPTTNGGPVGDTSASMDESFAEALAVVEHSARRPVVLPPVPPLLPLSLVPDLKPSDEPSVVDLAKAAAAKVVAAQTAAPKRRTTSARTTKKPAAPRTRRPNVEMVPDNSAESAVEHPSKPEKACSTALSANNTPAAEEMAEQTQETPAETAPEAAAPAEEPTNTRRIAKPRTDAPGPDTPPVTDAPVTGAGDSDEVVVETAVPLFFAATTAAGLPQLVPGDRS